MFKKEGKKIKYPASLIENASLGEKLKCQLRLQIISGEIASGSIMSENQLAAEYEISRAPVREALRVLAGEGLLRLERQGIVILGLSRKDMDEIYDVRYLIEMFASERIAANFDSQKADTLHQIIDKMELAAKHQNYVDFSSYDIEFHEAIIRFCNHSRMLNLWNHIRPVIFTALLVATKQRFQEEVKALPQLIDLHRHIVSAIEKGDSNQITKVIKEHYSDTFSTVYQLIFNNSSEPQTE